MNELLPPPASLTEAIFTEPLWLQIWVMLLVIANMGAVAFVVSRPGEVWRIRKEAIAIITSFVVAAIIMDWMYLTYGYVRLLGMAHLLAWTPAYVYVLSQRKHLGFSSCFGKYIHFYLLVAGISLLIDVLDVIRYFAGDGELFWS